MLKYKIIRVMLRVLTFPVRIYESGVAPIHIPEKFLVFQSLPPEDLLEALIKAYQKVFSEPPWGEDWTENEVLAKLKRELAGDNSFLVLMCGNEKFPVVGFSWGSMIPVKTLEKRVEGALTEKPVGLEELLQERVVGEQIVYFDEFAILRQFRTGLEPIRFLLRPGLELGWTCGVHQTMFWSTPRSNIVPLASYMGYEPIFRIEEGKKKIIFLYNQNFLPLLKVAQHLRGRQIVRIMQIASRILGKRKRTRR